MHIMQKQSIIQEKIETPPEVLKDVAAWDRTLRPHHIVAERSVRSQANIHENYKAVFSAFGDFSIQTEIEMTNQHNLGTLAWHFLLRYQVPLVDTTFHTKLAGEDLKTETCQTLERYYTIG